MAGDEMSLTRSRWVFAPVQPRLARWEHKRPQGAAGH